MNNNSVKEFQALAGDWIFGSLVAASLDKLFSNARTSSNFLNTLLSLGQFTLVTFVVQDMLSMFKMRRDNSTLRGTWMLYQTIWQMSPDAVDRLVTSYRAFHKLSYGQEPTADVVQEPKKKELPN